MNIFPSAYISMSINKVWHQVALVSSGVDVPPGKGCRHRDRCTCRSPNHEWKIRSKKCKDFLEQQLYLWNSLMAWLYTSTKWKQIIQLLIKTALEIVRHFAPASSQPLGVVAHSWLHRAQHPPVGCRSNERINCEQSHWVFENVDWDPLRCRGSPEAQLPGVPGEILPLDLLVNMVLMLGECAKVCCWVWLVRFGLLWLV